MRWLAILVVLSGCSFDLGRSDARLADQARVADRTELGDLVRADLAGTDHAFVRELGADSRRIDLAAKDAPRPDGQADVVSSGDCGSLACHCPALKIPVYEVTETVFYSHCYGLGNCSGVIGCPVQSCAGGAAVFQIMDKNAAQRPGMEPLYLCASGSFFRLGTNTTCNGWGTMKDQLGYLASTKVCGTVPLYLSHHAQYTSNFMVGLTLPTTSWINDGVLGYVWPP